MHQDRRQSFRPLHNVSYVASSLCTAPVPPTHLGHGPQAIAAATTSTSAAAATRPSGGGGAAACRQQRCLQLAHRPPQRLLRVGRQKLQQQPDGAARQRGWLGLAGCVSRARGVAWEKVSSGAECESGAFTR